MTTSGALCACHYSGFLDVVRVVKTLIVFIFTHKVQRDNMNNVLLCK